MSNVIIMSVDDDCVVVKKHEYESKTRDSEIVRCIESLALNEDVIFDRETVLTICGRAHEKYNNEEVK